MTSQNDPLAKYHETYRASVAKDHAEIDIPEGLTIKGESMTDSLRSATSDVKAAVAFKDHKGYEEAIKEHQRLLLESFTYVCLDKTKDLSDSGLMALVNTIGWAWLRFANRQVSFPVETENGRRLVSIVSRYTKDAEAPEGHVMLDAFEMREILKKHGRKFVFTVIEKKITKKFPSVILFYETKGYPHTYAAVKEQQNLLQVFDWTQSITLKHI